MKRHLIAALGAVSALALALPANAQQEQPTGTQAAQQQQQQDSQCIQHLQQLAQNLQEDGYWLAGYRGFGTMGVAPTAPGAAPPAPGAAPVAPEQPAGEFAVRPADPADPATMGGPWGGVAWEQRPQYEIGVLYEAAFVLGTIGDEENCLRMAEVTQERYQSYVAQLEELGIDPQQVTDWRRAEIAASEPVSDIEGRFRIDNIIGMNVRNAQDESLGSISDIMLDPRTGAVQYVTINYGGFLGIGADEVVVPWEMLRAMPARNAFVLPVERAALEQAPTVPDAGLIDPDPTAAIDTSEVDAYWGQTNQQQQQQ